MTITDTELQEKIKIFITKLDRMESRVREVETVAAKLPSLEATLSKIALQVDKIESRRPESFGVSTGIQRKVTIGLFLMGALVLAWVLLSLL